MTCEDGHVSLHPAPLPAGQVATGRVGVLEDLDVYDTLASLFIDAHAPYREHGIIEHAFADADPGAYRDLVQAYGHTSSGPRRHTASAMLARALGQLSREGHLASQRHRGTGYWSYNSDVGYWALAPGPDIEHRRTWAEFAEAEGIHPLDWPATGYRHDAAGSAS